MKHALIVALGAALACASCHEGNDHTAEMALIKDSIFEKYPTVSAVTVNVQDGSSLIITLGDQQLYQDDRARRQQTANEIGLMVIDIFGKGNDLHAAKLVVTKDVRNTRILPPDGLSTPINLDSLSKAVQ